MIISFQYCKRCGLVYYDKPFARMCGNLDCRGDLETLCLDVPVSKTKEKLDDLLKRMEDMLDETVE